LSAPAKFLFDADFGPVRETAAKITPAEHQTAVATAEQRGYQRGLAAAEAQARTAAERRAAATHERIATALAGIAGELKGIERRLETEAVAIAVTVAKKLAHSLLAREPLAELSALISECINSFLTAPHVVVRVSHELYPAVRECVDSIATSRGFAGRLVVLGDQDVASGDCRIEWADGGVIRERAAIEAAIADLVSRYLTARPV
jgi:flagellar assembly protein FliH